MRVWLRSKKSLSRAHLVKAEKRAEEKAVRLYDGWRGGAGREGFGRARKEKNGREEEEKEDMLTCNAGRGTLFLFGWEGVLRGGVA